MIAATTQALVEAWDNLQALAPVSAIRTEQQYDEALATLHTLLDTVRDDETHPLFGLLDTLGVLIQDYEERHEPIATPPPAAIIQYFMDEHGLTLADMPEIGEPEQVAAVLAGNQPLKHEQAQALARRFGVSLETFDSRS